MICHPFRAAFFAAVLAAFATAAVAEPVTRAEETDWIRWSVPLPKKISIPAKTTAAKGTLKINAPGQQDMVIAQAVRELTELVGTPGTSCSFTITLIVGGDQAEPLRNLKNADQSYRIIPDGENGLKLVALTSRGIYYAAKTLQQLIRPKAAADKLVIPLAEVTDWPDMEDRGLWGTDSERLLAWMAERKMNLQEQISARWVSPDGTATSRPKSGVDGPLITEAPRYGINPVPVVLHLEQLSGSGVFTAYPNLVAKSEKQGAWCYSQPEAARVIAAWIADLGTLPNVKEVDVWLSENMNGKIGCQCEKCKAEGVDPQVLEARTVVKAWKLAREKTGKNIGLRMLTSEACEHFNPIILSELPREVRVVYYHSLMTYTHAKIPMIHDYLVDFVRKGGWLAVCPALGAIPNYPEPFTCPQFINTRMNEFLDKGLKGLLGYASPGVLYTPYNVEAAAEWTWNQKGRSIHEFSVSYAVRQGYPDPEKFAEWVDVLGEVEWDVYASDYPWRASRKMVTPIDQQLKEGTLPDLGTVMHGFNGFPFGGFKSEKQIRDDVALAGKAVALARELGIEQYVLESLIVQGYVRSLEAFYDLKLLTTGGRIAPENRAKASASVRAFVDGLRQACDALPKWEQTVTWRGNTVSERKQAVAVVVQENLIEPMLAFAREMGLEANAK